MMTSTTARTTPAKKACTERKPNWKPQKHWVASLIVTGALLLGSTAISAPPPGSSIVPAGSAAYGRSYAEWTAAWWTWAMGLPLTNAAGATHPFIADPHFDVTEGQTGTVWYLGAPFGTNTRNITIPAGTALLIGTLNTECSDLENLGNTYDDRLKCAVSTADTVKGLFFILDGTRLTNITSFRVVSPQFTFTAPTPWIFGSTGGTGTAVADGYFVLVNPLPVGQHVIRFGGSIVGFPLDITYNITVR